MIANIIARLFPVTGQPLTYQSTLNGTRFATQWTLYAGPAAVGPGAGLHEFLFYLELDPSAIGQGGSTIRQRSRLLCDESLGPVRYHSQAMGAAVGLRFEGDAVQVDLPDGTTQTVPAGGSQFLMEANMSGQQALLLALAAERGLLTGEAHFTCFIVNSLLPVPYATTPASDLSAERGAWLRSSHEEELLLGPDGVLECARTPTQAIEVLRQDPAPPLPDWRSEEQLPIDRPRYAPPPGARFRLEEVDLPGPVTPLGAAVTIPPGAGPFPAVLFLSGSGTHDRHGISGEVDLGSHELVDDLSEHGYLGLRYDTRGAGRTLIGADALEQGLVTTIEDARAALRYLRGRPDVDPARIFLLGHSQGGTVALALGAEDHALAGVVLLATIGRGIDELLKEQTQQQCRWLGLSPEQTEAQVQRLRDYVALVQSGREWLPNEIPDALYAGARSRRWIAEHLQHLPTELMRSLRAPVLIMQGEKDFQVSPERDAARLLQAAQGAGLDVVYELLPGLDHLFKRAIGDESRIEQYFDRSRHVDGGFLARLRTWLDAHLPGKG